MFNTGTVTGICANIFGGDFPEKFISSFSWGGSGGWTTYDFTKCLEMCRAVMKRREVALTEADIALLRNAFERSAKYRKQETSI